MKKIFCLLAICAYAISLSAQVPFKMAPTVTNGIYFENLSEKTQIGMGTLGHNKIFAVVQKGKKDKPIKVEFKDQFGNTKYTSENWKIDTVFVYGKYVEYDYILDPTILAQFYRDVENGDVISFNGEKFSATLVKASMQYLDEKYNRPNIPAGRFFPAQRMPMMFPMMKKH